MSAANSDRRRPSLVSIASEALALPIVALSILSLVSNLLMLTGPLFMLQVYDRVLASQSIPTLIALTLLVGLLFAIYGVVEAVRLRMVLRTGNLIDERIRGRLFRVAVAARLGPANAADPLRDGEAIRGFTASTAILSFFDIPWTPLYVVIVFLIHPMLGWLAVGGIVVVSLLLILNEFVSKKPSAEVYSIMGQRQNRSDEAVGNAETVIAMGMISAVQGRWESVTRQLRSFQSVASDRASGVTSASKSFRFFLQSAVLAAGAYLVIEGQMSPGAMIAASVITARALAPVEQMVGHWRSFLSARQAWSRAIRYFQLPDFEIRDTQLPLPTRTLSVEKVSIAAPGSRSVLLAGLNFEVSSGAGIGIIGPSGSGKTSLARLLVGAWEPTAGDVRWDGASMSQYDDRQTGRIVGYLPQRVELFEGTIAENIARFTHDPSSASVIDAARRAGAHDLIVSMSHGYDTPVGRNGTLLSAGQQQRIGLARAVYGRPFLVVLDEPDSNLDKAGEEALTECILRLRRAGSIVVVVAHRRSAVEAVDHILVLQSGRQLSFGEKGRVLDGLSRKVEVAPVPGV